jgi:hypothetical protein
MTVPERGSQGAVPALEHRHINGTQQTVSTLEGVTSALPVQACPLQIRSCSNADLKPTLACQT